MDVESPNLFDYATSELIQDGFFAYFLRWMKEGYEYEVSSYMIVKENKIEIYSSI